MYNLIAEIEFILQDEVINDNIVYKINENISIGAFKVFFIGMIITENKKKQKRLYDLFYQYVVRCKTAIISDQFFPRDFKNGNLKSKINYKRAFYLKFTALDYAIYIKISGEAGEDYVMLNDILYITVNQRSLIGEI